MTYLYAAVAIACLIMGAILMHLFDNGRYDHLQSRYQYLQAADDKGRADRLALQNAALADALKKSAAAEATNQQVIHDLNDQAAVIHADRDALASQLGRVLAGQTRPGGSGVPQGSGIPGTAPASPNGGNAKAAGLLADAIVECRGNAVHQNALIRQLAPQL